MTVSSRYASRRRYQKKRKELKVRCVRLLSEITCGALERLLTSQLLRATVATVLYRAIRSAHPGIDDEQFWAVMPTARDDEQEVGP